MAGQLQTVEEALNHQVQNSPRQWKARGAPGRPGGAIAEWVQLGTEEALGQHLLGG